MNQDLIVGILLIIVGLAVGLIAVALVLNRRAERSELQENAKHSDAAQEGQSAAPSLPGLDGLAPHAEPAADPSAAAEPLDSPPAQAAKPSIAPPKPETRPGLLSGGQAKRELVAEIYRDPGSGVLVLRTTDNREYRRVSQIEDELLRVELAALASDLSGRFAEPAPSAATSADPRQAARPGSRGMLEGINAILQRSLAEAGDKGKGVQLIPDTAVGVKVLIGLKSYGLDDVPDEEIKQAIRQAVAEWEAGQ